MVHVTKSTNNLFQKISDRSLNSSNDDGIKEIADQYNMGISTIHSTKSFYDFLAEDFKSKKVYVCTGSACLCRGTQDSVTSKLNEK